MTDTIWWLVVRTAASAGTCLVDVTENESLSRVFSTNLDRVTIEGSRGFEAVFVAAPSVLL